MAKPRTSIKAGVFLLSTMLTVTPLMVRAGDEGPNQMTQSEAVKAVLDYVRTKLSGDSPLLSQYEPAVIDQGSTWGVYFRQKGSLPTIGGGTPEFDVDKKSGDVVLVGTSQ